jgi:AraC-like DNA-binding protein
MHSRGIILGTEPRTSLVAPRGEGAALEGPQLDDVDPPVDAQEGAPGTEAESHAASRREVSTFFLKLLLDIGTRRGTPLDTSLAALGVDKAVLADTQSRIDVDRLRQAWKIVPALSGHPNFGLEGALDAPLGHHGVLEFAILSSPTCRIAIERGVHYYRLMGAMCEVSFVRAKDESRLVVRGNGGDDDEIRHYFEYFVATIVTRAYALSGSELVPKRIIFPHREPQDASLHRELFRCPLEFGHRQAEIVWGTRDLDRPLPGVYADYVKVFEVEHVVTPHDESLSAQIRGVLPSVLRVGDASVVSVAKKLGMSKRTLQRRLQEEGASFSTLVDETRKSLATRYVQTRQHSLAEVAFMLGFAHVSAFHRAFRRWTKKTPEEFRSSLGTHDGL